MVRNWHELGVKDTYNLLGTNDNGLSALEAKKRLRKYGPNEIQEKKKRSRWMLLVDQFRSFLIIILIVAAVASMFIGSVLDSAFIIIIIILNAIFGFVQEYKAEKAIDALKKLTTPEVVVIHDGKEQKVSSRDVVPGDIIILEQGTKVPADLRLIEITDLKIDESAITGESVPSDKELNPIRSSNLAERKNIAYMGTMVTYGRGKGVVVDTGMRSEMGSIAHMIQSVKEEQTPLQKNLGTFGKNLGIIILAICGIIIMIGLLRGFEVIYTIMTGIALAVAAVPEGLPAVVTITLALGIQRMSKENAIVRKMPSVETLGSTTVICSDKTGTLTRNEMVIRKLYYNDKEVSVTGRGYEPEGHFVRNDKTIKPTNDRELNLLMTSATLCNNSTINRINQKWETTGDPTEISLKVAGLKAGIDHDIDEKYERVKEIPFTSERKMMTSVNMVDKKLMVCTKGAPEIVLKHCNKIISGGKITLLTKMKKKEILERNREFTQNALRVLGVAYKEVSAKTKHGFEKDLIFIGLTGMIDSPREGVREDIALCKEAGIKVVMITGDHKNTAVAIARELGIIEGDAETGVLTGEQLEELTEKQLESKVEQISIYARVNPEHKVRIVDAFKAKSHVIAMTGDGVNDAPALKKADIGISMGISGTDVAKEASDMILKDDNFSTIVTAIRGGRTIYDNIKKFVQYLLSSNFGEVALIFVAMLIGITNDMGDVILPLTPLMLLWINLVTDGLPALALGVDLGGPSIIKKTPRNPREKILNRKTLLEIIIIGCVIAAGTLFLFSINMSGDGSKAQTIAFTALVALELVRVQSIRMKYKLGLLSNPKLIIALLISLGLQLMVIYSSFFQSIFGTVPLNAYDWLQIIMMSSTLLIIMWVRTKLFTRNG